MRYCCFHQDNVRERQVNILGQAGVETCLLCHGNNKRIIKGVNYKFTYEIRKPLSFKFNAEFSPTDSNDSKGF